MLFARARHVKAGRASPPRHHPLPRVATPLALAAASVLVACGPDYGCFNTPSEVRGTTRLPVTEPVAWVVTLCLDDDCAAIDVDSEVAETPDVTGSLFERFVLFPKEGVWAFRGEVAFGSRSGELRVSLAVHDRDTGALVLSAVVDHLRDDDRCFGISIDVSEP